MSDKTYYLEISSDPSELPQVEDFIQNISEKSGLTKNQTNNLMMAVNEATTNGMLHGNKGDIDKKVKISVKINEDDVSVTVKDEGEGFDPSIIPDPTQPENIFKDSGRGLYIMRTCCDEINYIFTDEGTELTITLYRKN